MSQLKPIKPEVLIGFLKKQGFVKVRQRYCPRLYVKSLAIKLLRAYLPK